MESSPTQSLDLKTKDLAELVSIYENASEEEKRHLEEIVLLETARVQAMSNPVATFEGHTIYQISQPWQEAVLSNDETVHTVHSSDEFTQACSDRAKEIVLCASNFAPTLGSLESILSLAVGSKSVILTSALK